MTFYDNNIPDLKRVNNMGCTGVKIDLHPDEPPDDLTKPFWVLKYPPKVIHVVPDNTSFGHIAPELSDVIPKGAIPVHQEKVAFELGLDRHVQ